MKTPSIFLVLLFVVAVGCGPNVKVTGTVTFEDGSPLTKGEVRFETATFSSYGGLNQKGAFTLSGASANSGIPPGRYGVAIVQTEQPDGPLTFGSVLVPQIHTKYNSPATSGLSVEVKRGMGPVAFTVEPYEHKKAVSPRKQASQLPPPPPGAPH
ncbi:MAG: hypothetical protein FWC50_04015 [Planctomycetaceae bacterium]|nr:hypothetical protein [Planctomycetaceae bacterium]